MPQHCHRAEPCCGAWCAQGRGEAPTTAAPCGTTCTGDWQCPGTEKCTSTGCGRVCMDVPGGRVGACPIPREAGTCLDLCSFDEECPWGHKCCSNGCGHVCTPASLQGQALALRNPFPHLAEPSGDRARGPLGTNPAGASWPSLPSEVPAP
uniref:WAP domain-containing protein n=1 Tax=Accipiter nisus TaxID=211598 RepID=A0A8B9MLY0_9AVES